MTLKLTNPSADAMQEVAALAVAAFEHREFDRAQTERFLQDLLQMIRILADLDAKRQVLAYVTECLGKVRSMPINDQGFSV